MALNKNKRLIFEKQEEIIKAVSHPVRIAILDFLKDTERCVCDIAEHVGSERSNVSKHLAVMHSAGIVEQHKEGLKVLYRVKTPCLLECFICISNVIKEQAKESKKLLEAF